MLMRSLGPLLFVVFFSVSSSKPAAQEKYGSREVGSLQGLLLRNLNHVTITQVSHYLLYVFIIVIQF